MEEYSTTHLEGNPWEELPKKDKQKFIERQNLMRTIFSREHKCIKMSNFGVTDSRFNAHITLPKVLPADKEVYIHLRRETFMKTMKKYLKKYEKNRIKINVTSR